MATKHHIATLEARALAAVAAALVAVAASFATTTPGAADRATVKTSGDPPTRFDLEPAGVRTIRVSYLSHTGQRRNATVLIPNWYGPGRDPKLPLVISPHGRGATGRSNAKFWGDLPAVGRFAVISPDGMGRVLKNFSYGYPRQIDDLAKMPAVATRALPWLRLDRRRVYALGSSMGGQETLLLVARHPHLLAGAAALDSVTDLVRRYRQLPSVPCNRRCVQAWGEPYGVVLQKTMSREVGGSPAENPQAYAARSAASQGRKIAFSGVPLQIWWSTNDRIVSDQAHQSAALFRTLRRLNRCAPVSAFAGRWAHSHEMRASALLPIALEEFGLLPPGFKPLPKSVHHQPAAACWATHVRP
jgi:poly(3-hydroxybutyrate) depolymerase